MQYNGRTVIVSPLLALEMALSCILAIHIRNMAHKDTRYRSKTQVINAVMESFLSLTVIVIRRANGAVVNSSLINFHMVPLVTVTVCR